ncbi:hypothetical protein BDV59DRAFT_182636 [Aspergillus ambiguus]|uniref:monooxygenase fmaE n=1 Tax=Aspergillus ambiguus TaxID=176160 RepID=UPI003CCDB877
MESRLPELRASDLRPRFDIQAKHIGHNVFRDNFSISTWMLLGAFLQGLLCSLLPLPYAVFPTIFWLACRGLRTVLTQYGVLVNRQMENVILGKFSVQIPSRDGSLPTSESQDVAVILLGTRSNHTLGVLGPGFKEVGQYMTKMLEQLESHGDEYGYLGQTTWIEASGRTTNNQVMVACYFRSLEAIHRYAHGPLHRDAWKWWNTITKVHPHLSIMHEVYHAPKGHWENIYINNHLVGVSAIRATGKTSGGELPPILDASRGSLRSQMGRIGRSDGTDNDIYGPEPY